MTSPGILMHQAMATLGFSFVGHQSVSYSTLYENNRYIRLLNQILCKELSSIELYGRCGHYLHTGDAASLAEAHRYRAKKLLNMILANRGLPVKRGFYLAPELSLITGLLPRNLAQKTTLNACFQLERSLVRRYKLALTHAPHRDQAILREHTLQIFGHIDSLRPQSSQPFKLH